MLPPACTHFFGCTFCIRSKVVIDNLSPILAEMDAIPGRINLLVLGQVEIQNPLTCSEVCSSNTILARCTHRHCALSVNQIVAPQSTVPVNVRLTNRRGTRGML